MMVSETVCLAKSPKTDPLGRFASSLYIEKFYSHWRFRLVILMQKTNGNSLTNFTVEVVWPSG